MELLFIFLSIQLGGTYILRGRTVTATPYDDGCQWRKQGQKVIRGAQYPRNYFHCTYSSEQGCPTMKQVQQMDNEYPPKFLTIYTDEHTCKDGRRASHVVVEPTPTEQFSINFVPNSTAVPQQHLLPLELRVEQEDHHEISGTPSDVLFSGSELMDPMSQFWMNTPDVAEAPPVVSTPNPQISEIERFLDSVLRDD